MQVAVRLLVHLFLALALDFEHFCNLQFVRLMRLGMRVCHLWESHTRAHHSNGQANAFHG